MKKKIQYDYRECMGLYSGEWYRYIKKWYGWKKVMFFWQNKEKAEDWMKLDY